MDFKGEGKRIVKFSGSEQKRRKLRGEARGGVILLRKGRERGETVFGFGIGPTGHGT